MRRRDLRLVVVAKMQNAPLFPGFQVTLRGGTGKERNSDKNVLLKVLLRVRSVIDG